MLFSWRDLLTPPHSAAMSNYALCQSQTGSKASDELFIACREPAADASCRGRGSSRILLCSAAGAGVFKFRGCRRALAHTLKTTDVTPRRSARFFNSTYAVALQAANTAGGKRRPRNRQRHRCGKQHHHSSKQSEYITFHEPVPRLAPIESIYHANQGWQPTRRGSSKRLGSPCR